jgi:hypothetical protein
MKIAYNALSSSKVSITDPVVPGIVGAASCCGSGRNFFPIMDRKSFFLNREKMIRIAE